MSKAFYISLGLILSAPAVGQLAIAGYSAYMISSFQNGVGSDARPGKASISDIDHVYNAKKGSYTKPGFRYLRKFDDVDAGRTINFTLPISLRDLLKKGEKAPDPDLRPIFVEARAKEFGRKECEKLVSFFASECLVKKIYASKARYKTGQSDLYDVRYTLGFVQKDDFGEVNKDAQVTFEEIQFNLFKKLPARSYRLKNARKARTEMLREVLRRCEELKKLQGNCAISQFDMHASQTGSNGQNIRVTGSARLSYLQGGPVNISAGQ